MNKVASFLPSDFSQDLFTARQPNGTFRSACKGYDEGFDDHFAYRGVNCRIRHVIGRCVTIN